MEAASQPNITSPVEPGIEFNIVVPNRSTSTFTNRYPGKKGRFLRERGFTGLIVNWGRSALILRITSCSQRNCSFCGLLRITYHLSIARSFNSGGDMEDWQCK